MPSYDDGPVALRYASAAWRTPLSIVVHTWVVASLSAVAIASLLLLKLFPDLDRASDVRALGVVAFSCTSPLLFLAAALQVRGVFQRRPGHLKAAAFLQIGWGGVTIFGAFANIIEAFWRPPFVGWSFVAVAAVIALIGGAVVAAAIRLLAWAKQLAWERDATPN